MSEPIDYQKHWDDVMAMTEGELDAEIEKLCDLPEKMGKYRNTLLCRAVLKVLKEK